MPTIDKLSPVDSVVAGDLVPIFSIANSDARSATMQVLADFFGSQVSNNFQQTGTGAVIRTYQDKESDIFSVRDFTGSTVDGVTSNQVGITNAVNAAMNAGAMLYWPAGTYVSTENIPNLHSVRHIGPGAIKRGTDTFVISGRTGSNKLYVATTGSSSNDGLSSAQPMLTLQQAVNAWSEFAYALRNAFTINLADGTYTEGLLVDGVKSPSELIISGASKAGTIIDGTTSVNVMGLNFNNINNARVKNLTVRNWPGVGSGIIFQNGTRGVVDTCDATNNAEANFNCSEDAEMVFIGVCTSTGSKQGIRYYRNSGGSVGDGTNAITITGATQSGLVARDGSKVVTNNNFNVNSCNSTATTTGVLVQKDGYVELRTCTITGNSIGVYVENNSIVDTQTGTRNVSGNTQNYRIRDGSFDRSLFTFSADIAQTWIPNSNPTVQTPSSNYGLVVNYAGATGLQFLTSGQNVNIDFDKLGRISHVASDNTLRFSMNNVDTFRMSTSAYFPATDNARTLGLNSNRWSNLYAYNVTLKPPASVTPANNGDMTFELTSDTQLKVKVKGSDGTVRSTTLTLS